MLSIKSVNFSNGLKIVTTGSLANVSQSTKEIEAYLATVLGNLQDKEDAYNKWLSTQAPMVTRISLSNFPPDDPVKNNKLSPTESIDGSDLVIRNFYAAIHILRASPLKITAIVSDAPIGGDWWL